MTFSSVLIALAVIVVVLARRMRGEVVPEPKKLFLLPVIAGVIGLENIWHATVNPVDIAVIAVGSAISLGLGLLRGRLDTVTMVNGAPFMRWTTASLGIFAVNVVTKVVLDLGGVAAGGTASALSSSILFSLGLTLMGEAAIIWLRSQSLVTTAAPGDGQYRGTVPPTGRPTIWPPIR
jgi:hypothetical protein